MTKFLNIDLAIRLHRMAIERHGGMAGIRDQGGLESALAQPEASFGGDLLHPTIFDQAAAYLFHIAKNHPFLDGNKRAALACALVFLEMNGYAVPADENDALEALTWRVAEGRADKAEAARYLASLFSG